MKMVALCEQMEWSHVAQSRGHSVALGDPSLGLWGQGAGALADVLCVSPGVLNVRVLWSSSGAEPALHAQGMGTRVWQAD